MFCGLGRLFLVSNLSSDFSVVGFHSPSLMLLFFFSCFLWYKFVELVSWCFGLFYSELFGSSLVWGSLYVVVLSVRCFILFSWWLCIMHVFSCFVVTLVWWLFFLWSFFVCFGLVFDRVHLCSRLLLSKCYYSILFFLCDCGDLSLDYVSYSSFFLV